MNCKKKLIIFVDNHENFLVNIDTANYSMDIGKILRKFTELGYEVELRKFSEFDPDFDYEKVYVLYHITEDAFTIYKSYVEDIITFIAKKGAILLPSYDCARAHHDKIYMELLRTEFKNPDLKSIQTRFFGNAYEAIDAKNMIEYPVVVKISDGAASRGVVLARDADEYVKKIHQICKGKYYTSYCDLLMKTARKILTILGIKKYKLDKYYGKIIVQNFIPGLSGDYKVLYFGGKYYTLKRLNRKNDFRASGSGIRLPVPDNEINGLLDFAKEVVKEINFSIIGMDIGFDGNKYHLLEFQMIHLGPYTLSRSEYYHVEKEGYWEKVMGKSDLEEEFCRSIDFYIKENSNE